MLKRGCKAKRSRKASRSTTRLHMLSLLHRRKEETRSTGTISTTREDMHAASDESTQHLTTTPPGNPYGYSKIISPSSQQGDETSLSMDGASTGDYMDCEPSSSEYDVASAVLNGITTDSKIVEKLARFLSYNDVSLRYLYMSAYEPGKDIQSKWLKAGIVETEEDLR